MKLGYYDLTTQLLAIEVERLGFEPHWLLEDLFVVDVEGRTLSFWGTQDPNTGLVAAKVAKRKHLARELLSRAGISIAEGKHFSSGQVEEASEFAADLSAPVVVKPAGGRKGRSVEVGLRPGDAFRRAFRAAARDSSGVLVEKQFVDGSEARMFVVGGRCQAAYGKRPPQIEGDGVSTISELVQLKNKTRKSNPHLRTRPLLMTEGRIDRLRAGGYDLDHVLVGGERLLLDSNANVSAGGESMDITGEVHPSYFETAVAASRALSLEPAGVDIIAHDFSVPASMDNHVVLEVNSSPALGAHHFPLLGESRNVAEAVVRASIKDSTSSGRGSFRFKRGLARMTRKVRQTRR